MPGNERGTAVHVSAPGVAALVNVLLLVPVGPLRRGRTLRCPVSRTRRGEGHVPPRTRLRRYVELRHRTASLVSFQGRLTKPEMRSEVAVIHHSVRRSSPVSGSHSAAPAPRATADRALSPSSWGTRQVGPLTRDTRVPQADGQPGTYGDIEHADAIFLFGHNMPETHTVLWARVLDRSQCFHAEPLRAQAVSQGVWPKVSATNPFSPPGDLP
jgi:hypothetical protein